MDYLWKAGSAWFLGFFPLAEIYVAVPYAMALGLDDVSTIVWTVFGNFTPALLISAMYQQLLRIPRIAHWMERLISEKAEARVNRWGGWFVLIGTPLTGIWVMAVTAQIVKMNTSRFLLYAFLSILLYAVLILVAIRLGVTAVD